MNLDRGLRTLRWRLRDMRKEVQDRREIPLLSPSDDMTSCVCRAAAGSSREGITKDSKGG